jgi:hypothetical protein
MHFPFPGTPWEPCWTVAGMVVRDNAENRPASVGGPARVVIGAAVFLLGMLVGAAIAAWVVPPA